ncbi:DUF5050 domain-containing protein [Anaerocolumna xylanovorans]|uniref:Prolow-density lipoprotein receptor-related protein 1-like beta-propeller domain-containing protein n=1 Tax=Anaerocolumna xylanovorans DSM 12503 TaxID=1121345 RepID=A0A1M7YMN8_9FIRM|nr:DUF5050 domain-containing protein [Anaerocolumna xylanovorans]SHO53828.1 protein of unknown function [Anaerocolumna xylanovorans DSM 12503]
MDTITKRILSFILVFFITIFLLPQNILITSAATNATVYEYSSMLEDRGNIYYIQTVEGDKNSYDIYRLEVATGKKTKILSSKNDILGMMLHNDTLYYTSYEREKEAYQTYSVSIDAKDKKTICNGYLICLDDSSIYYTVIKGEKSKLYKRDYDSKKATLIYTGNMTFSFVKNLDNTLYFTQFNEASSKLTLYKLMPKQTKLAVLTTDKIALDGTERTSLTVSDLVKINGDIYYQYGTHEGSGSYWYGTLKKLDSGTNKKSIIAKQLYEEQIYHNDSSIFYNGTDSSEKRYRYNTKTSKTSSYIYKTTGTESFNILGDKTYCAKADGKELITVSRFTSGTNKNNLVKSFISLSYKQKEKFNYSACVKKYGDYLLIPVTCMDYSDTSYGWRGRCVSVTWYVADSDGKILAQFQ